MSKYLSKSALYKLIVLFGFIITIIGCKDGKMTDMDVSFSGVSTKKDFIDIPTSVQGLIVTLKDYQKEILTYGKARSKRKASVHYSYEGMIKSIDVVAGQRVKKGQVLSKIEDFEIKNKIKDIEFQLAEAHIKSNNRLIQLGFSIGDSISIPTKIYENVLIENKVRQLENEMELLSFDLQKVLVKAPISGVVSDLDGHAGTYSANVEKLCDIIDDKNMEIVFQVLEEEYSQIRVGLPVYVSPLHNSAVTYKATISIIKPIVDENGMIEVIGRVVNKNHSFLDGMNLKIRITNTLHERIVVPKEAVLQRDGKQVVFTYVEGLAHWNYVETEWENSDSFTIKDGLSVNDTLLTVNNFHLSHLKPVVLDSLIAQN